MYQYDDPTAVASLPAPTTAGTAGYFTDGNPASGQPSTILRAEFMNMLMKELLNIVVAGGVTPSKAANNQVLLALQALFDVSFSGNATAGHLTLPGGFIVQWGTATGTGNADVVTLPVPYPNAQLAGFAIDTGNGMHACAVTAMSQTTITLYGGLPGSGVPGTPIATAYRFLSFGH